MNPTPANDVKEWLLYPGSHHSVDLFDTFFGSQGSFFRQIEKFTSPVVTTKCNVTQPLNLIKLVALINILTLTNGLFTRWSLILGRKT